MKKGSMILVVDDNDMLRQGVLELLTTMGYESVGAADGSAGLQLAKYIQPDLIILDVMMPDMDGFSVLKALRSKPITKTTPVLMLTGIDPAEISARSTELGEVQYMSKPFAIRDLVAAIEACLRTAPSK